MRESQEYSGGVTGHLPTQWDSAPLALVELVVEFIS